MKKALFTLLLLLVATAMNAQTIVKGDMNNDDALTISDAVNIVNVILGHAPIEYINLGVDAVDNSSVVGKWYAPNGTSFMFNEDGTTTFLGAATYKFRPLLDILTLYDTSGSSIKAIVLSEVTPEHLLSVDLANGQKVFTEYTSNYPYPPHEYVDLGLPSGTLWAAYNVGASSPEEYGDYFAWGETVPLGHEDLTNTQNYTTTGSYVKNKYDWTTYKWCKGTNKTLTKYNNVSNYGTVDNKKELDLEDDAAYVNWGPEWRMPSDEQISELLNSNYTTVTSTTRNGVYGRKITSKKNNKSIFFPYTGWYSTVYSNTSIVNCWSRTRKSDNPPYAYYLRLMSDQASTSYNARYYGYTVRAVRRTQ